MFIKIPNVPNVAHNLPVGSRLSPLFFRELRKPWGLDPWYYKCSRRDTYSHMPAIPFSTFGVHCDTKGGKICDHTQGFKKPPVPRRLVGGSQIPPGLSPTYTGTGK